MQILVQKQKEMFGTTNFNIHSKPLHLASGGSEHRAPEVKDSSHVARLPAHYDCVLEAMESTAVINGAIRLLPVVAAAMDTEHRDLAER